MIPTRQFPVRNLTEKLGLVVFMLIMLLILAGQSALAQRGPKYNLKHVDVRLMNGRIITGQLKAITEDSIILLDKNMPIVGSEVYITFSNNAVGMSGTIRSVTESTLLIETSVAPYERLVQRSQIRRVRVKSYPSEEIDHSLQGISVGYQEIDFVGAHRVGSGGLGALVGGLLGGLLGSAMGYAATSESDFMGKAGGATGGAVFGVILGLPLGAAVGSSNRKIHIGGDKEKFAAWRRKLAPSLGQSGVAREKKK